MFDRLITSLMALCLAILAWLYARDRDEEILDNVPVPVQIVLAASQAEQYDMDVPDPCHVLVSFTGPPSRMRELRSLLHRGELRVEITLNVPENLQEESRSLDTVRVDAADIHAPRGVTPMLVEGRNRIPVTLHRLVERRLPVRFNHLLEDRLDRVVLEPATVLVRGQQEILDRTRSISTQPYSLPAGSATVPGEKTTFKGMIPLVREIEGRAVRTVPNAVMVCFTVKPRQKLYELAEVTVQFLCPANFPLRPQFGDERAGKIGLRVQGPAGAAPTVVAYVDLTGRKFEPGLYADEPLRLQLPNDFQLAQDPPRSASFRLAPIETPFKDPQNIRLP